MPTLLATAAAVARSQSIPSTNLAQLRPVIIGPQAKLHRYAQAAEKPGILLGSYNFLINAQFPWPSRDATSIIDLNYVKVWLDNALLQYYTRAVGSGPSIAEPAGYTNRVRVASGTVFKTANGFARSTIFNDRDVQVGDVALVSAVLSGTLYSLTTTVTGFNPETISAVVGAATSDTNDKTNQSASVSISQVAGTPQNEVVAVANGSAYNSLVDGYITRTYTITVTQGSSGGNATTALLKVVSADGLDNQTNVVPAAFSSPTSIGTHGLTVTFSLNAGLASSTSGYSDTDLVVGQQWTCTVAQNFTAPTPTSGGTYGGAVNAKYIVKVSKGGKYTDPVQPQITVSTDVGVDSSGPTTVTASGSATVIGTQGVTISFNQTSLCAGDIYYVPCTAAAPGAVQTLILANDLTSATSAAGAIGDLTAATDLNLTLYIKKQGLFFPQQRTYPTLGNNWTTDQTNLYLNAGAYTYDPTWTLAGVQLPLLIASATVYAEYREWVFELAGPPVDVTTLGGVAGALGTVDPDNPIAFAAYKALQNTGGALLTNPAQSTAPLDRVRCVVLGGDPTLQATWQTALNSIQNLDHCYYLVPLTQDVGIQGLVTAHVDAQSAPAVSAFRACLLSVAVTQTTPLVTSATTSDGLTALATLAQNPATVATSYTLLKVASGNSKFITNGVVPGDTVRYQYTLNSLGQPTWSSFQVLQVLSEGSLLLASGPAAPVTVAQRVEVWRSLSTDQVVAQVSARAAALKSNRHVLVWPDTINLGGVVLPGYYACAAIAGLAGSVPSQQGLRNIVLQGFDAVPRSTAYLTSGQRLTLAASGVYIVNQDLATGSVYTSRANTTDPTSVPTIEELVRRNTDLVTFAVQDAWGDLIGAANITDSLFTLMRTRINNLEANLISQASVSQLGPPLHGLTITSLGTSSTALDHTTATLTIAGGPIPNNLTEITVLVT
jgi:hypothetical protein